MHAGEEETIPDTGSMFDVDDPEEMRKWQGWRRWVNYDAILLFFGTTMLVTIIFTVMAMNAADVNPEARTQLIEGERDAAIPAMADAFGEAAGILDPIFFIFIAIVGFKASIGLFDAFARGQSDMSYFFMPGAKRFKMAQLYAMYLWGVIIFGVLILNFGPADGPTGILDILAFLSTFVMGAYCLVLAVCNRTNLPAEDPTSHGHHDHPGPGRPRLLAALVLQPDQVRRNRPGLMPTARAEGGVAPPSAGAPAPPPLSSLEPPAARGADGAGGADRAARGADRRGDGGSRRSLGRRHPGRRAGAGHSAWAHRVPAMSCCLRQARSHSGLSPRSPLYWAVVFPVSRVIHAAVVSLIAGDPVAVPHGWLDFVVYQFLLSVGFAIGFWWLHQSFAPGWWFRLRDRNPMAGYYIRRQLSVVGVMYDEREERRAKRRQRRSDGRSRRRRKG